MKFKRKAVIKYLKVRRSVFKELINHVKNGQIKLTDLYPDVNVQILWIEGRINLLDVLICGIESKDELNYIKVVEKL